MLIYYFQNNAVAEEFCVCPILGGTNESGVNDNP